MGYVCCGPLPPIIEYHEIPSTILSPAPEELTDEEEVQKLIYMNSLEDHPEGGFFVKGDYKKDGTISLFLL